jgi:hypothetical protein
MVSPAMEQANLLNAQGLRGPSQRSMLLRQEATRWRSG